MPEEASKKDSTEKKRHTNTDQELFKARDKNKDGKVTWEEFLNGRSGDVARGRREERGG